MKEEVMDDRDSGSAGSFLGGVVLGAVLGLVLGLLFAPQSGEETRGMIKEKTSDIIQKAKKIPVTIKESVKDKIE
jgi:gas vesicle protein